MAKRIISAVFAFLVVLALLAGVALLLEYFWAPILFWGYVLVAVLVFLIAVISGLSAFRQRSPLDPLALETGIIRSQIAASAWARVQFYANILLSALAEALAWPAAILATIVALVKHGLGTKEAGSRAFLATMNLNPPVSMVSVTTAVMAVLIVMAGMMLSYRPHYRQVFLLLLALSAMVKHVGFLISAQSLPQTLRRSIGDPYSRFVAIGVSDFLTIVLAFSAYAAWSAGQPLGLAHLRSTATNMLTVAKLRGAVFSGDSITWPEFLVSLAGGFYILNGFKALFKYREFNRTAEDLQSIAVNELAIGKHREARKWLDKVAQPDATSYEIYTAIHLADGDVEAAEQAAANLVDVKKVPLAARPSDILRTLIFCAVSTPLTKEQLLADFRRWVAAPSPELFLHSAFDALLFQGRLTPEEALALFDGDEAAKHHGLSLGVALIRNDSSARAHQVLADYTALNAAEEVARVCLIYRCLWGDVVDDPSDARRAALNAWGDERFPQLQPLLSKIRTDYERLVVMESLYAAADFAETVGSPHLALLNTMIQELKDALGGEERVLSSLRAIEEVHQSRLREFRKHALGLTS